MKRILPALLIGLLVFLASGCLDTLYPIFYTDDAVFNEHLLGYWKCSDKGNNISFMEFEKISDGHKQELVPGVREISDRGYFVTKMDTKEEITDQYFVFLARIGKYYYLDYYPAEMSVQKKVNQVYKDHFIKLHRSYRCDFKDIDHIEMRLFDQSFLDELISKNQINIRHEVVDGKNVITASTGDLQKFIRQYSDNPEAFGGDISYCSRIVHH